MLKLLKHDIKDSYLEVVILNAVSILLSLIVLLGIKTKVNFLFTIGVVAWAFSLLAVFVIVLKTIIKHFHSKLFTDYGYLTLTTPVSIDKILISKIIVSMLWLIVTVLCLIASVLIFVSSIVSGSWLAPLAEYLIENPLDVFKFLIQALASALCFIMMLIFVLVLVNMGHMKKHKTLIGIFIYIGLGIVQSVINQFVAKIGNSTVNYFISLAVTLVLSVLIYFASRYLITHKLELE